MKWVIWLWIVLSANCSLPIKPDNFYPWYLNYCFISNNKVVRAGSSIGSPLRSWTGQLTLQWWITKLGLQVAHSFPSPELLQKKHYYIHLTKMGRFQVSSVKHNCEVLCFKERIMAIALHCFLHTLLNDIIMIRMKLALLLSLSVVRESYFIWESKSYYISLKTQA